MAAVSLFWDTNMAAIASCENTQYSRKLTLSVIIDKVIFYSYSENVSKTAKKLFGKKSCFKRYCISKFGQFDQFQTLTFFFFRVAKHAVSQ